MRKLSIPFIGAAALLGLSGACEDEPAVESPDPVAASEPEQQDRLTAQELNATAEELRVDPEMTPGAHREELDDSTAAAPDLSGFHPESGASAKPSQAPGFEEPDPRPTLEGAAYLPAVED